MKRQKNIPFFGIDRIYKKHSKDIINTVDTVYSKGKILMGPDIKIFEEKISKLCKRKYAVAVNNCTDALYFALLSAGIGKNDEVLVTGFSYIASVTPILRVGAIPVFVDIEPDYYMMNLSDLENKITPKTKAILAVHLFGQMLAVDRLEKIAKKNNLVLIEDAAQSQGSKNKNKIAGSIGITSCLSFDPTKIIGAFGTAGTLLTDNKTVYNKVKKLRYHGKNFDTGEIEILGYNSHITTLQAALINLQLNNLAQLINKRNNIANIYNEELSNIKEIETPKIYKENNHTYHKYVIKAENRNGLKKYLDDNNIKTMTHYEKALFEHPLFKNYQYRAENLPVINSIKNKVLSLPIYPELHDKEIKYLCKKIKKYFQK
jgi:dTDP-4-amino-4,6-dideoxygalactose transaminase